MLLTFSIFYGQSLSPVALALPLGYSTRLYIKQNCLIRQFPLAAQTQDHLQTNQKGQLCFQYLWTGSACTLPRRVRWSSCLWGEGTGHTGQRGSEKGGEKGLVLQHNLRPDDPGEQAALLFTAVHWALGPVPARRRAAPPGGQRRPGKNQYYLEQVAPIWSCTWNLWGNTGCASGGWVGPTILISNQLAGDALLLLSGYTLSCEDSEEILFHVG